MTLQRPEIAWETGLVLPLSWWLVLSSAAASGQKAVVPAAVREPVAPSVDHGLPQDTGAR